MRCYTEKQESSTPWNIYFIKVFLSFSADSTKFCTVIKTGRVPRKKSSKGLIKIGRLKLTIKWKMFIHLFLSIHKFISIMNDSSYWMFWSCIFIYPPSTFRKLWEGTCELANMTISSFKFLASLISIFYHPVHDVFSQKIILFITLITMHVLLCLFHFIIKR